MKKTILAILTLIILVISNYTASNLLKVSFIDLSFITGVLFTSIIGFFSTDDSIYNRILHYSTAIAIDKETTRNYNLRFFKSIPFFVSLIYTIISAILTIYIYWDYFL